MQIERKLVVEFIGTFFLVFTIGMAVPPPGTRRRSPSAPCSW
jgi:glycerol uptake facilitator-like aquaporin